MIMLVVLSDLGGTVMTMLHGWLQVLQLVLPNQFVSFQYTHILQTFYSADNFIRCLIRSTEMYGYAHMTMIKFAWYRIDSKLCVCVRNKPCIHMIYFTIGPTVVQSATFNSSKNLCTAGYCIQSLKRNKLLKQLDYLLQKIQL